MNKISKFEIAVKVTENMIAEFEAKKQKAIKEKNYSRAAEMDFYVDGMSQALTNFQVSGALEEIQKTTELLEFAKDNLSILTPYLLDPDSDCDKCRICSRAEFDHEPDCKGKEWEKSVQELLDSRIPMVEKK